MIALHIVLVNAIVLKIGEDTIYHTHPEGGFTQARTKATQAEFIVLPSNTEGLQRSFRHIKQQQYQTKQCATNKDNALNSFCPNHGLDTTYHGVCHNGQGSNQDDTFDVPTQQFIHGQCQEIKDGTHTGYLSEQIERRGIYPRPSSETLFKEAISRYTLLIPIEGDEILGRKEGCDRNGKTEHKRIPVACKSLTWISQIADATHISSED